MYNFVQPPLAVASRCRIVIDKWLQEMLVAKGVMSATGLTRKARIHSHRPCSQATVAGYDADVCALDAWCDLHELTADGEVLALLDGRVTYEVDGERLHRRDRWAIRSRPAGGSTPVLAEHRCDAPLPFDWRAPTVTTPPPPATDMEETQCPF